MRRGKQKGKKKKKKKKGERKEEEEERGSSSSSDAKGGCVVLCWRGKGFLWKTGRGVLLWKARRM